MQIHSEANAETVKTERRLFLKGYLFLLYKLNKN